MTTVTTPRVRNFGVGMKRRHRPGSCSPGATDGAGVDGRVGVAVVMYSPQMIRAARGCGWVSSAAQLVTVGEQVVVALAPLLLLVEELVHVDRNHLHTGERILQVRRLDRRRETLIHEHLLALGEQPVLEQQRG